MTTALRLKPGEARWSQASRCARMSVYGLRGTPERVRSEKERRYLHRGRLFGQFVAEQFAEVHGPENVIFEKEVAWGDGNTLHTDVFVVDESAAFEVKSTTSPASLIETAIIQNAGEQHFDSECDKGGVIMVDPNTLEERVLPVVLNDKLRERVESIAAQVTAAGTTGPLPARVCQKPSDAIGKMCPFAEICFADEPAYVPEPPILLNGEHAELAAELYRAKREVDVHKSATKVAAAVYEARKEQLRDLLEPNRTYETGGVKLCRSVSPRVTFAGIAAGIEAGHLSAETLAPYRKEAEQERWSVERVGELTVEDFGEVPF